MPSTAGPLAQEGFLCYICKFEVRSALYFRKDRKRTKKPQRATVEIEGIVHERESEQRGEARQSIAERRLICLNSKLNRICTTFSVGEEHGDISSKGFVEKLGSE